MFRPLVPLFVGAVAFAAAMIAHADEATRLLLDGTKVGADASSLLIPGKPNPEKRPLTPVLDLYPTTVKPAKGTVLVMPGGGYSHLAVGHEGTMVAKFLNGAGWDAAILLYHVDSGPDTRALALDDARKALALLQTRGAEFGLATQPVGAMGFSAGGHLTVRLANETAASGKPPAFLILGYPAYLEKGGVLQEGVTPINTPTFLCVGDQDKTYYPSSVAYEAACRAKGIRCDYVVAPGAPHGFGMKTPLPEGAKDWPDKLKAFLDTLPGGKP